MDWLGDHLWALWLGAAITLGVAEMFSLDLIMIMLAAGAIVGMALALLDAPGWAQVLAAAGTSLASLAVLRPSLVKRLHSGPELTLGHNKLIGSRATVTEQITGLETGRIRLAGEIWSAAPYDDTLVIESGATVEVFEIRGATAYVHPLPELEP